MFRLDEEILARHIEAALVRVPPAAFELLWDADVLKRLRAVRSLAVSLDQRIRMHDMLSEESGGRDPRLFDQAV